MALAELAVDWDLTRLCGLLRDFPWFRTANADPDGPTFDGFALFNYTPWYIARGNDDLRYVSSLVLDFKKNEPPARAAVGSLVVSSLTQLIESNLWKGHLIAERGTPEGDKWSLAKGAADGGGWFGRELVVIPGSSAGIGKPSTDAFAAELASVLLKDLDPDHPFSLSRYTLERHTAQTPSRIEKKSIEDHLRTIRLNLPSEKTTESDRQPVPRRWMLLDDVYTRGATYGACKQLIRERQPAADIMGLFVGITAY